MTTTIEGRDGSAALTCLRLAGCGGYCDAGERGAHTDTLAQRELAHGFPECVRVWCRAESHRFSEFKEGGVFIRLTRWAISFARLPWPFALQRIEAKKRNTSLWA